jgi:hypothetical protein
MRKRAVQLLILSMLTTALLVGPVVTQANATTNSGKQIKHKRVAHRGPAVRDPNANPFASKYEDDFDRKNAGGGGGY